MRRLSLRRASWPLILLALVLWSARGTDARPLLLVGPDGRRQIARFVTGLFPPELSVDYLLGLIRPAIETVQMSLLGVVFGVLIAAPLAVIATKPPSGPSQPGEGHLRKLGRRWSYATARGILNVMRTIPDLVWALMFIAAVGLGSFAGVLALTVHSAGLLGKLYAEAMESVDPVPVDTLRATGAGGIAILLWAVLPQAAPNLVSITLYQWECNIRAAMVLGFVGAGGFGQRIDIAMRLFQYQEMLTLLAALLILVTAVDRLSAFLRGRLARND